MAINTILVTGANGQLGWELGQLVSAYPQFKFVLLDRDRFDLSQPEKMEAIITSIQPYCVINTAAYTAVDKAEVEQELALKINATAVTMLSKICKQHQIHFITYSTDYVFDGKATHPYPTNHKIDPVNFYGVSKAKGENGALAENEKSIIIRTSWVFSSHGNNFVKTMLRLMKEREQLNIVADQVGRPTYAKDLASATMLLVVALKAGKKIQGIYHYANEGITSWYDFAVQIKQNAGLTCVLNPITTDQFPTPAKRPSYSVLDTQQIEKDFDTPIRNWKDALSECQNKLAS
jgi:dTDP-4-dehydrorhamnose reductase